MIPSPPKGDTLQCEALKSNASVGAGVLGVRPSHQNLSKYVCVCVEKTTILRVLPFGRLM